MLLMGRLASLGLGLYCGLIFYLSAQASLPVQSVFSHQDKLIHAIAYAVMAVLAYTSFRFQFNLKQASWLAWLFCVAYGLSDEWHQSFVAGRDADGLDWLADCAGAVVGLYAAKLLSSKKFRSFFRK